MLECGEEKVLTLTEVERIKALAAQLVKLLRSQKNSSLPVSQLLTEYSKTFGYGLRLQDYDASSLPALLTKLCHVVKVKNTSKDVMYWCCLLLFSGLTFLSLCAFFSIYFFCEMLLLILLYLQ